MLDLVEGCWQRLRRDGQIPARSDLDPREIEDALSHAFIAERVAPGHARLRIAGTHLSDLMGMEVRGMPFSALFEPDSRALLKARLEDVFARPAILRLDLRAPAGFRRGALAGRAVLLPMRNDMGDVTRLLGCLDCAGPVGRTPRRLLIEGAKVEPLDIPGTPASRDEAAPEASRPVQQPAGLAEDAAPFGPAPAPDRIADRAKERSAEGRAEGPPAAPAQGPRLVWRDGLPV